MLLNRAVSATPFLKSLWNLKDDTNNQNGRSIMVVVEAANGAKSILC